MTAQYKLNVFMLGFSVGSLILSLLSGSLLAAAFFFAGGLFAAAAIWGDA